MINKRGGRRGDEMDWTMMEQDEAGFKQQSFDIYVKGSTAQKGSTFFKSSEAQAPRFRMFPYVERRRRVDDFGEVIDVNAWLRKGKMFDAKAEEEDAAANAKTTRPDEAEKTVRQSVHVF